MNARFVPLNLKDFPDPRKDSARKRSQFKASWARTLELLDRELANLGATGVVLQAGFRADQIRNDGWPYGKARPLHPAVILSFRDAANRPLSFPCDRFDEHEDNIRAIALSLEALRAVDRFGVTKRSEQYAGFKQIEGPPRSMTVEDAAEFLRNQTGHGKVLDILSMVELYRSLYRTTAGRLHPDRGGDPGLWHKLGEAKELLDAHFGLSKGAGH